MNNKEHLGGLFLLLEGRKAKQQNKTKQKTLQAPCELNTNEE